jgi:hypothetical protein
MATRGVRNNAEVDCWFAELDPSIEPAAREERADELRRITVAWCFYKDRAK